MVYAIDVTKCDIKLALHGSVIVMDNESAEPVSDLARKILSVRGQRVLLDIDLAAIYGVMTTRLNEQVKRNEKRFPLDFSFVLSKEEFDILISQNARSSFSQHGGRRKLPRVFTEHGAIMAANVLRSEKAVEMSVFVVRAFVRIHEFLANNSELKKKLEELESRVSGHDKEIGKIFAAIHEMVEANRLGTKREIGFHVKNSLKNKEILSRA